MLNQKYGELSWDDNSIDKNIIQKANTNNLLDIFNYYNIGIDEYNHKIICPFHFHKNGQERSSSFYYYPDTNKFYCFGCNSGGQAVDFVSLYENITIYDAAQLINNNYKSEKNTHIIIKNNDNNYRIYFEFSHMIRNFIVSHKNDLQALEYAENICKSFDSIRYKYTIEPAGYKLLFDNCKIQLEKYQ